MAPWKLPLVVSAIAVPIAAAFLVVGPALGVAMGALVAFGVLVVAARQRPREAIGAAPAAGRSRLLIVLGRPVEEAAALAELVAAAKPEEIGAEPAEVLVLSPARIGFLDRWASDVEGARREAQQRLVMTVASLAKAGVVAEARVGDEDLVQAVEDQLRTFAATDVILVTGEPQEDPDGTAAAAELEARLRTGFRRLAVSDPAAR